MGCRVPMRVEAIGGDKAAVITECSDNHCTAGGDALGFVNGLKREIYIFLKYEKGKVTKKGEGINI